MLHKKMSNFRRQRLQYLAALSASILTSTVGFNVAWPSPSLPLLTKSDSPIGVTLNTEQSSWVSAITLLGILVGNVYLGQLQDLTGRKGILLMSAVPIAGSWIIIAFARSYETLLVGRFLNGFGTVVPQMTSAIYIGEIAEPSIRGKLGMVNLCMIEVGIVLVTVIGSYTSYLATSLISASVPCLFVLIFVWMPESPYYHLRKGDVDNARKCLKIFRCNSDVEKELLEIQCCVEKEMKEKSSIRELVTVSKYRKALFIGLGIKTLQQLSGTNAINVYNKVIFEQVSTGMDSSHSAIISTSIAIPAVLIGSLLIDKLGRKPLYYLSTIGCALALTCEFAFFLMQDYLKSDVSQIGFLPVTGIFLYNIFRTFGVQTLPVIIVSEIFPTNMKALGQNVIMLYNSLLGFLVSFGFPILNDLVGIYTCFGIFAVCCLLGFFYVWWLLPETKGQSLGEIQNKIEETVKDN